ncbi:hypothetical protein Brsp05_01874 [Brucella sp. NBRC 12953]
MYNQRFSKLKFLLVVTIDGRLAGKTRLGK